MNGISSGDVLSLVYSYSDARDRYRLHRVCCEWKRVSERTSSTALMGHSAETIAIAATLDQANHVRTVNQYWTQRKQNLSQFSPITFDKELRGPTTATEEQDDDRNEAFHKYCIQNDLFSIYIRTYTFCFLSSLCISIDTAVYGYLTSVDWNRIWQCLSNLRILSIFRQPHRNDNCGEWHIYSQMSIFMPSLTELNLHSAVLDRDDMENIALIDKLRVLRLSECECTYNICCRADELKRRLWTEDDEDDEYVPNDMTMWMWCRSDKAIADEDSFIASKLVSVFAQMSSLQILMINNWKNYHGGDALTNGLLSAAASAPALEQLFVNQTNDRLLTSPHCQDIANKLFATLKAFRVNHTFYVGNDELMDYGPSYWPRPRIPPSKQRQTGKVFDGFVFPFPNGSVVAAPIGSAGTAGHCFHCGQSADIMCSVTNVGVCSEACEEAHLVAVHQVYLENSSSQCY